MRVAFMLALVLLAATMSACNGEKPPPSPATPAGGKLAVTMKSFAYQPKDVLFKVGEAVQFDLSSTDIEHTFTVRELGIDWLARPGAPQRHTFTFAKTGTYKIICTIPGHEGAGMVGTITIQ